MEKNITTADGLLVSVQQENSVIFVNSRGMRIAEKHGTVWTVHHNNVWHRIMLYGKQLLNEAINANSFSNQYIKPQSND